MMIRSILLAGAGAMALSACGGGDNDAEAPKTEASAAAAKAETASPLDSAFRLKDAEETDIDALLGMIDEGRRPTYESAAFDASIGATVVNNLRFADADDGEAIIVERAEFYGVDEAAIDRVVAAVDAGADAPFETIFEKVRLLNIASEGFDDEESDEAMKVAIAGVEFDKLAIRQGGVKDASGDGAHFFNAVNLGGLYFKEIDVNISAEEDQTVAFSAPDMRLVGMAGGKIDAIIAKDIAYNITQGPAVREAMREAMGPQGAVLLDGPLGGVIAPQSQQASLGAFEWRDIDFSGAMKYDVLGEPAPVSDRDLIDFGALKITDMVSYVEGREIATIGELSAPSMEFSWLIPSDFRIDMKDVKADYTAYIGDEENPAYAILKDHGLDDVESTGFLDWKWNPADGAGAFRYEAMSPGFADMTMAVDVAGASLKEIGQAQEDGEEAPFAKNAKLSAFTLRLADEKALDAIFDIAALQMGGTGDDLRQSAPALIRLSGAQFAAINPRVQDYVNAVADFVADGGALEIAAQPEEPVGAETLQGASTAPQAVPDILNLTVTHSE